MTIKNEFLGKIEEVTGITGDEFKTEWNDQEFSNITGTKEQIIEYCLNNFGECRFY